MRLFRHLPWSTRHPRARRRRGAQRVLIFWGTWTSVSRCNTGNLPTSTRPSPSVSTSPTSMSTLSRYVRTTLTCTLYSCLSCHVASTSSYSRQLVSRHSVYTSHKVRRCQVLHLASSFGSFLHSVVESTVSVAQPCWLPQIRLCLNILPPERQGQADVLERHFHALGAKARTLVPIPSHHPLSPQNQSRSTPRCRFRRADSKTVGKRHLRH